MKLNQSVFWALGLSALISACGGSSSDEVTQNPTTPQDQTFQYGLERFTNLDTRTIAVRDLPTTVEEPGDADENRLIDNAEDRDALKTAIFGENAPEDENTLAFDAFFADVDFAENTIVAILREKTGACETPKFDTVERTGKSVTVHLKTTSADSCSRRFKFQVELVKVLKIASDLNVDIVESEQAQSGTYLLTSPTSNQKLAASTTWLIESQEDLQGLIDELAASEDDATSIDQDLKAWLVSLYPEATEGSTPKPLLVSITHSLNTCARRLITSIDVETNTLFANLNDAVVQADIACSGANELLVIDVTKLDQAIIEFANTDVVTPVVAPAFEIAVTIENLPSSFGNTVGARQWVIKSQEQLNELIDLLLSDVGEVPTAEQQAIQDAIDALLSEEVDFAAYQVVGLMRPINGDCKRVTLEGIEYVNGVLEVTTGLEDSSVCAPAHHAEFIVTSQSDAVLEVDGQSTFTTVLTTTSLPDDLNDGLRSHNWVVETSADLTTLTNTLFPESGNLPETIAEALESLDFSLKQLVVALRPVHSNCDTWTFGEVVEGQDSIDVNIKKARVNEQVCSRAMSYVIIMRTVSAFRSDIAPENRVINFISDPVPVELSSASFDFSLSSLPARKLVTRSGVFNLKRDYSHNFEFETAEELDAFKRRIFGDRDIPGRLEELLPRQQLLDWLLTKSATADFDNYEILAITRLSSKIPRHCMADIRDVEINTEVPPVTTVSVYGPKFDSTDCGILGSREFSLRFKVVMKTESDAIFEEMN